MSHDVFISYSDKDKAVADAACAVLERNGVRCWIAPRDIIPGQDWMEAIVGALDETPKQAFVLIFSRNANESTQVKREVDLAMHRGLAIIPVRIEDVEPSRALEYVMTSQHWMDAITPPLEKHLEDLAKSVRILLRGENLAPPLTPPVSQWRRVWRKYTSSRIGVSLVIITVAFLVVVYLKWRSPPNNRLCPATHPEVYDICKGCNPLQESLANALNATDSNTQVRAAVESCTQDALASNFLENSALSGQISACIKRRTQLDSHGTEALISLISNAQNTTSKGEVDEWLTCRRNVRLCGKAVCGDSQPLPPPPVCAGFVGRWRRGYDQLVMLIQMNQDCEMTIDTPGTGFIHTFRAKAQGNELMGAVKRTDRNTGCTVYLHVRYVLTGDRIRETVEGVDGQCDIGPGYREDFWFDRVP